MLYPSLHLFPLVGDRFSTDAFEGCCFALSWSESFRDAIVHASDVTCVRCSLDVATELLPILVSISTSNWLRSIWENALYFRGFECCCFAPVSSSMLVDSKLKM